MNVLELQSIITEFVQKSSLNTVEEIGLEKIFAEPLIGVASADDLIFKRFKEPKVIGAHHLLPKEWLPGAKSVISYFLPFTQSVRKSNYTSGLPSTEWLYGRIEGEDFNVALRRYLTEYFQGLGSEALAPALDSRYKVKEKRSNWSERHAAYAAGLGTFGLSRSLITTKGCAGRYGSIIVSYSLDPTPRAYTGIYEYCNNCWECIDRCPSGAIKKEGKDIWVCSSYSNKEIKPRFAPRYGCGKCQTDVPCETGIPG